MKKNQLALIFLTLVVMLAVWFIKSPLTKQSGGGNTTPVVATERLSAIILLRENLRNERSIEAATYDAIIASSEASIIEKNQALKSKETISDLTEKEVLLEVEVMTLGYTDCFCHATASGVDVLVVSAELTQTQALEIIKLVLSKFDAAENVVVNFKSEDDLVTA